MNVKQAIMVAVMGMMTGTALVAQVPSYPSNGYVIVECDDTRLRHEQWMKVQNIK